MSGFHLYIALNCIIFCGFIRYHLDFDRISIGDSRPSHPKKCNK